MVRTSRKLPTEWEKYEPIGQVIANTRIFAFKTPLKLELQARFFKAQKFSTLELYRKLAEAGKSLGLVINATNTERYYDRADIEGMSIGYQEILCPGRGFLDRDDLVNLFFKTVDDFLAANDDNDLLIGVHCSNGVNRSGYLICRYLIDRMGWSSHQALEAFETARGYSIERGSFVQALHKADRENRLKKRSALAETAEIAGNEELVDEQEERNVTEKKKKRKRRKEGDSVDDGEATVFDPSLTAQMMQQFMQMEQQFKQAAENAVIGKSFSSPYSASPSLNAHQSMNSSSMYASPSIAASTITAAASALRQQYISASNISVNSSPNISNNSLAMRNKLNNTTITSVTTTVSANVDSSANDFGEAEDIEDDDEDDKNVSNTVIDYESMGKVDVIEVSAAQQRRQRRKKLEKKFQTMKRGRFWEINELRKEGGL